MTTVTAVARGATPDAAAERRYGRRVWAWALYDVADHAYITSFASTFFPPYFIAIAAPAFVALGQADAIARDTASNYYAFATSFALFLAAILAPIIGAYADIRGVRKRGLIAMTAVGSFMASAAFVLTTGMWELGLAIYILTQIAMNICLGLSSSLLPHVARPDDMNRVSSLGYAMGYFGGGVLLLVLTILYILAAAGALPFDAAFAARLAFFSVGIWWLLWSIPTALGVPEPPATPLAHGATGSQARDAFTRLGHTLRDISRYRELFKMLIAFWLYMEGIGAIILLATAYGAALGLSTTVLIGTLLMTQFVAFPYALIFGRIADAANKRRSIYVSMLLWTAATLPLIGIYANVTGGLDIGPTFALIVVDQVLGILFSIVLGRSLFAGLAARLDTKRAVLMGLLIYIVIPIWGFYLKTQAEFFLIGWMVGTVQGGTQALSRSIYADLSPRAKSGEFFGLYGLSEKFAGILGPLLYGIVGQITHDPRASVLSISVFFVLGIIMLWRVNERAGAQVAAAEEAQIELQHASD